MAVVVFEVRSQNQVMAIRPGASQRAQSHRRRHAESIAFRAESLNGSLATQFAQLPRKTIMNKNQVKGTVKDIAGKVQEEAGKLVGNKEQEAKGIHKQVTGKAEKRLGDAKEIVEDAKDAVKDAVKHH